MMNLQEKKHKMNKSKGGKEAQYMNICRRKQT